ncbi:hypothetical protein OH76DRAFT_1480049 [Lentinus brumalis]|uniref:Mid2 domain-containing protein n=1 Tax=Lentinus brumalis TaxID=2498619 RepID=A0A371DKF8_9APHY|nr:hypothetical protein OH76DRAFT_1480049 [Polyporus brumalis]
MTLRVLLLSLALCLFLGAGKAQVFADCQSDPDNPGDPGPWSWMNNDNEEDPCLLVAYLQVPCTNQPPSHQALAPLKQGAFYTGPPEQNDCLCNTVAYSLIEACQLCQWNVSELVQPWSGFSRNCSVTTNGSFPFSFAIPIPQWAYLDVYDSDHFNLTAAQQVAEGSAFENSSSSSTSATTTATASANRSSSASTTSTRAAAETDVVRSGKSSNVGAIVGGVVGGVLGILSLGTIVFYFAHRWRNLQRQAQLETSERPFSTSTAFDESQPSLKPGMAMISPPSMIYDPNDPRTFPSFQTLPSPADMRAVSPTSSRQAAGSVGGPMQNHPASSFYGGDQDYSSYPTTTYTGVPEI